MAHEPVLVSEVLAHLAVEAEGTYLDGTVGAGGHAAALLEERPRLRVIGLDRDAEAIGEAAGTLRRFGERVTLVHASYAEMERVAREVGVLGSVAGILLDLGVSSTQLDLPERGMSYRSEGPLDLRFDRAHGESAADWIERAPAPEMARVFRQYGEIPRAGALAGAIDRERRRAPIRTTADLAESLRRQLRRVPPDLLSRVFQAIRIEVNDELGELERGLDAARSVLARGGRLAVIAYHSLEDRIVKRTFLPPPASRHAPPREEGPWEPVVRRAIRPTGEEIERNPRARSARLRVAALRAA